MGQIIGGILVQTIGAGLVIYAGSQRFGVGLAIGGLGLGATIAGLFLFLDGLRRFFLDEVLAELKQIVQNTTPVNNR